MGWKIFDELFKSDDARQKENEERKANVENDQRRKLTAAKLKATRAIEGCQLSVKKLEETNAKTWANARRLMKEGKRSLAAFELKKFRTLELMLEQFNKKIWIMEFYLIRLDCSQTDALFSEALGDVTNLTTVDLNTTQEVLDKTQELIDQQNDVERLWNDCCNGVLSAGANQASETTSGIDELMKQLEAEAACEVGGAASVSESAAQCSDEIAAGRASLEELVAKSEKQN